MRFDFIYNHYQNQLILIRQTQMISRALKHNSNFFNLLHRKKALEQSDLHHNSLFYQSFSYFSRKKKQNMQRNLSESADKELKQQIEKSKNNKQQRANFFNNPSQANRPSWGYSLGLSIIALILYHSRNPDKQKEKFAKEKQEKNTSYTAVQEHQMKQLIVNGFVLNHSMQISRVPIINNGRVHYSNQCMIKGVNGQHLISDISNLPQFIMFVQKQPIDYKISFAYRQGINASQNNMIGLIINSILIGVSILVLRKLYTSMKSMSAKGNGFDFMDKKKVQAVRPQDINVLFKDVAGMHQAKFQVTQFVDFLKTPERYIQMGAKIPKGALLTGPPGTGKTLLAKACAGEAGVPFFYVSGSDFVEKYVGLGASRVRKLFDQAQKNSPSIIFIDQIDAIGKKRQSGPFANQQANNTLNQLLVRMDGFDSQNKVIVMAATNIKDSLDPALLRPGRFDRSIQIGLPNFDERKQILQVHLKKIKFDPSLTIQQLANKVSILTPGFSGAQLANVCNQAAILAAREQQQFIQVSKFQKATERVMAGLQKRNLFTEQQKQLLAYYESGKAVVGWFTQGSDPVIKISILPFSKASKGYSHTIKDELGLHTLEQLLGKACFYLSGRSAENHFKTYVSTNGDEDLKRAKRIITLIVTKFGMTQRLKMIAFPDTEFMRKPYSPETQIKIDEQIERITNECKKKVSDMIVQKAELIQKLKQNLLKKQTLNHNQIKEILGDRPFSSNQNYEKFIKEQRGVNQVNALEGSEKLSQKKQ